MYLLGGAILIEGNGYKSIWEVYFSKDEGDKNKLYPRHPNTSLEGVLGRFGGSKYLLRRCLDL